MASNREFCLTGNPDSMPQVGEFYYYLTNKDNAPLYQAKTVIDTALTDIGNLKSDSTAQAELIGSLQTITSGHTASISTLETDVTEAQGHITDLQTDNETTQIAVSNHETEITSLQTDNTTNKSDISTLQTDVIELDSEISTLSTNVTTLQTDNTTNKSDISDLKTTTASHTTSIGAIQTDLAEVEGTVVQHGTEISGLTTRVNSVEGDITSIRTPIGQCYVSSSGNDNHEGSISRPFKTIQKALNELFGVINVLPSTYTENITIPIGYGQYAPIIQGYGTIESPKAEIRGTLTIPSGVSRLRIKNLQLDGKGEGSAIVDNGSDGRHVLENVTLANAGVGNGVITVINGKNWWNIVGSAIEGAPYLTGTPTTGTTFNIMYSPNSFLCTPIVETGYTLTTYCVGKMGYITHSGGNVYCSNIGAWYPFNSKIINSTSTNPTDIISVSYSGFSGDGINYGTISTTGATVIKHHNIESPYDKVCLSAISTVANTLITTTASTLIAGTKEDEIGISYNSTNGEVTFLKSGIYSIGIILKVDCTEWNKKLEIWIEKYNTSNSTWEVVPNSGFIQNFQTDQENVPHFDISRYFVSSAKYRMRAKSDSDTTVSLKTIALSNGVNMPAIRVSIVSD